MFWLPRPLRCFFYLFRVPEAWCRFLGFGREIPRSMVPQGGEGKKWYLCGTVLPMGYFNSVGVAQHIHRAGILKAMASIRGLGKPVQEIRRDRVFSNCSNLSRVYLDNFNQLQGCLGRRRSWNGDSKADQGGQVHQAGVGNHWQGKSVPKGTSGGWRWFRLHSHVQKTIAIFFEPDLEDNC